MLSNAPPPPPTEYLNVRQAAEYTGYSEFSVRQAAAAGNIKHTRRPTPKGGAPYRFTRADLDAWLGIGGDAARSA